MVYFESIQLIIVFSCASTLTSRKFENIEIAGNYVTAGIVLLICIAGFIGGVGMLMRRKRDREVDTKEIYPGVERWRDGAEMYMMWRGLGLISIAVGIPLLHSMCVIGIAFVFLVIQLHYVFNCDLFKLRVLKYLRVIHTFTFMLYNMMYIGYYIIEKYWEDIDVEIKLRLGNVSMGLLILIYLLDLVQLVIDIGEEVWSKITGMFKKKKAVVYDSDQM